MLNEFLSARWSNQHVGLENAYDLSEHHSVPNKRLLYTNVARLLSLRCQSCPRSARSYYWSAVREAHGKVAGQSLCDSVDSLTPLMSKFECCNTTEETLGETSINMPEKLALPPQPLVNSAGAHPGTRMVINILYCSVLESLLHDLTQANSVPKMPLQCPFSLSLGHRNDLPV